MEQNNSTYLRLREEYPCFEYRGFDYGVENGDFTAVFHFVCGEHSFNPKHVLKKKDFYSFDHLTKEQIELLLFNIGMIELISYWKAFCSKKILIKGWSLTEEQLRFWRKIYFYGLGEFFFLNGIKTTENDFVEFECAGKRRVEALSFATEDRYIVPIGGGKDSVVSFDVLYGSGEDIKPFVINMRGATRDCCLQAGVGLEEVLEDRRSIDAHLLELNAQGFLNGHTPFSAMLAFTSLLVAAFSKRRNIALSNENSANESTVIGEKINHQYSKSLEFENDFRAYVSKFVSTDFNYFSFLRPLSELNIARLFAQTDYLHVFKSCNAGSKQDVWCGNCPKCLFAFIILSPFVEREALCKVFGKNLFEDENLKGYLLQLCGQSAQKPFECVGTIDEVNTALAMRLKRYPATEKEILLKTWLELPLAKTFLAMVESYEAKGEGNPLFALSTSHNLSAKEFDILSNAYQNIKRAGLWRMLSKEKIAILGYGREGKASERLLGSLCLSEDLIIADQNAQVVEQNSGGQNPNGKTHFVFLEPEELKDRTLFLKTPGISCKAIPFVEKEKISSQSDLFLRLFADQTIGISGTKGKSTTSSLIYKMIKDQNPNVILAGNIGIPLFDVMDRVNDKTIIVAELSAHQLQFVRRAPHISVLLNLYEEHLDHFDGFSDYCLSKFNLAVKQSAGDYFVYNAQDERIESLLQTLSPKSKAIGFKKEDYVFPEPLYLKGEHNHLNALAALRVAELLGLNKEKALQSLHSFEPLAHRLQRVGTFGGVTYYNDSISTIGQATVAALSALKDVDTLILGGKDRGIDYGVLVEELPKFKVRNIAFTGAAGRRMKSLFDSANLHFDTLVSDDYAEIVAWCAKKTERGKICLLSPAASSYDAFRNFEHRGEVFSSLVRALPNE